MSIYLSMLYLVTSVPGLSGVACGQCEPEQFQQLAAAGTADGDQFGAGVAIAEDLFVIGATYDDGAGPASGAAHAFDRTTHEQLLKLTAADAAARDHFGYSVAVGEGFIAVGAPFDDDFGQWSGSAYLFNASTGEQLAKLVETNGVTGNRFGLALAIGAGVVFVGSPLASSSIASHHGAVHFFDLSSGQQVRTLLASDAGQEDAFGWALALNGDRLVVGMNSVAFTPDPGAAYIFERNEGGPDNWGEVAKLIAPDAVSFDMFGSVVAIDGDTVVAGAPGQDVGPLYDVGAAYVFDRDAGGPGQWGLVKKLTASDAGDRDWFGTSVAVSGDVVLVGCPYDEHDELNSGSVYIFMRHQGGINNWGEVGKFGAAPEGWLDNFGSAMVVDGDTALVGARFHDGQPGRNSGAAYLFNLHCKP